MYTRAVVTGYLVYVLFRGSHVVECVARENFYLWFIHVGISVTEHVNFSTLRVFDGEHLFHTSTYYTRIL